MPGRTRTGPRRRPRSPAPRLGVVGGNPAPKPRAVRFGGRPAGTWGLPHSWDVCTETPLPACAGTLTGSRLRSLVDLSEAEPEVQAGVFFQNPVQGARGSGGVRAAHPEDLRGPPALPSPAGPGGKWARWTPRPDSRGCSSSLADRAAVLEEGGSADGVPSTPLALEPVSTPGSKKSPPEPMDRGVWWATVRGVAKGSDMT